jgi:hypothetical protein
MTQYQPHNKKIFTDISPRKKVVAAELFREPAPRVHRPNPVVNFPARKRVSRKLLWWGLAAIGIVALGAFWSIGNARMSITVKPKRVVVPIDANVSLVRNDEDNPLRLIADQVVKQGVFRGAVSKSVVQEKAKGSIVIYNKASATPQQLIANTRFEASNGKIYRIPEATTIPGYTKDGSKIIPGSREVIVVADKPGPDYNIGLVDFTIPGFKGSPKYITVFARSKTEMTGGFSGERATVNPDDLEKAMLKLKTEAEEKSYSILQAKLDPGSVMVKQTVGFVTTDAKVETPADGGEGSFALTLTGESRGAFVSEIDVLNALGKDIAVPRPYRVTNLNDLSFEFSGYSYDASQATLYIKGSAAVESVVDTQAIKKTTMTGGLSKSADILRNFPALTEVSVQFRPLWFRYVPLDEERIDIIIDAR